MTAERGDKGTTPPVYPVPPPLGIIVNSRSMHALTIEETSLSLSG